MKSAPGIASHHLAGPDVLDRIIGTGALLLLAAVCAALIRGQADLVEIPWQIWAHLATIVIALGLTPAILWQRRGTALHRFLGYVWVAAMAITASISFDIRQLNSGDFSPIHLLSGFTLLTLVGVVVTARKRDFLRHRKMVRLMALGALLISGFLTFQFDRMLGHLLFS